jgi:hypothetical protein
MNSNHSQSTPKLRSIQSQARLLISQARQQQRNRQLSMLQRVSEEIGTEI